MEQSKNEILVITEQEQGKITTITKELLSLAYTLAREINGKVSALIIGNGVSDIAKEAILYGSEKVYLVNNTFLSEYNPEIYISAVTQSCQKINPLVILIGQTSIGRDIAARVAFRLKCFPFTDSIKLNIDPNNKSLTQTRMAYSGKALATVGLKGANLYLATVRQGAAIPLSPDNSRTGEILNMDIDINAASGKTKLVSVVKTESEEVKLEEAEVIVAGGGGIGGPEGFKALKELAKVWNGAIGATRVPCDEGWVPSISYEIGLTGKTVKPKLYFAIGISGAAQHVVGCSESKLIVSINKDPEAGMFKVSDLGIVGDYKAIVPELINQSKATKS